MINQKSKVLNFKGNKGIRSIFGFDSKCKNQNCTITLRVTSDVRDALNQVWKVRVFPHPDRPNVFVRFRSRAEYLDFCIRCLNRADNSFLFGQTLWYYFSNIFNPDFKEEKKK